MSKLSFFPLDINDSDAIVRMSDMATSIVRDHYDAIIGKEQNDYMINLFQTPSAIRGQLEHGYRYFFANDGEKDVGFMAFFPRGEAMYLSKLYLYKEERGKGYSRQMIDFVSEAARSEGLNAVELNVNRNNSSVNIYEKLGFKVIREEKNDIGSGFYMDDYVYSLDVDIRA